MDNRLSILIKKSLEIYDKQNFENIDYIKNSDVVRKKADRQISDHQTVLEIMFISKINNESKTFYDYEILGIFDKKTQVWGWSWIFPMLDKKVNYEARQLLNYALDKNLNIDSINFTDEESLFIKSQLSNSRLLMTDSFQLDLLLALCSYLLHSRINFIYPEVDKNNPNIITFILVK